MKLKNEKLLYFYYICWNKVDNILIIYESNSQYAFLRSFLMSSSSFRKHFYNIFFVASVALKDFNDLKSKPLLTILAIYLECFELNLETTMQV